MYLILGSLGRNGGLSDFAGQLFYKMPELTKTVECRNDFVENNEIVCNDMPYEVTTDGNVTHFGAKSEREALNGESYGSIF